jgi:ribosome maturation factor RimP
MPSAQRRTSARPAGKRPAAPPKAPPGDLAAHKVRITEVVEPVATAAGYDLEDLAVVRMGRRFVVRVTVDRDGGVPLDAVAELARAVSTALDEAESTGGEFIGGEYQLEVSSPGVDRPLTAPRHWRRNIGRLVKVKADGAMITGRITAVTEAAVTFDVAGAVREVAYPSLGAGRVEIEFSRIDDVDDDELVDFESGDDDPDEDEDDADEDDDDIDHDDADDAGDNPEGDAR